MVIGVAHTIYNGRSMNSYDYATLRIGASSSRSQGLNHPYHWRKMKGLMSRCENETL